MSPRLARRLASFRTDARGAAAVEFAFIATILLALLVGGLYLTMAIAAKRDTGRAAAEFSNALSQCTTSDCVLANGQAVMAAQANVFPNLPNPTVSWAMVSRSNGALVVDFGNMTVLDADVKAAAMKVLANDNDNGVCVVAKTDLNFNMAPASWGNFDQARGYTCNLQSRNVKMVFNTST